MYQSAHHKKVFFEEVDHLTERSTELYPTLVTVEMEGAEHRIFQRYNR